jgi:predicted transcriptional regulator
MTENISTPVERVEWLTENYDLSTNNAKALLLAEIGFSHSGIAKQLGVTEGTARKYLRNLKEIFGDGVIETVPKRNRYPTYPGDTPLGEYDNTKDIFGERRVNRGTVNWQKLSDNGVVEEVS